MKAPCVRLQAEHETTVACSTEDTHSYTRYSKYPFMGRDSVIGNQIMKKMIPTMWIGAQWCSSCTSWILHSEVKRNPSQFLLSLKIKHWGQRKVSMVAVSNAKASSMWNFFCCRNLENNTIGCKWRSSWEMPQMFPGLLTWTHLGSSYLIHFLSSKGVSGVQRRCCRPPIQDTSNVQSSARTIRFSPPHRNVRGKQINTGEASNHPRSVVTTVWMMRMTVGEKYKKG